MVLTMLLLLLCKRIGLGIAKRAGKFLLIGTFHFWFLRFTLLGQIRRCRMGFLAAFKDDSQWRWRKGRFDWGDWCMMMMSVGPEEGP